MLPRLSLSIALCAGAFLVGGCTPNNASSATGQQTSSVASSNALTPLGTTNVTDKEANFAIYYPAKAMQTRKEGSSQWGKYQIFTSSCQTAPLSYVVIATTIPEGVDTSDTTSFINGIEKGLLKRSGATLDSSREITLQGASGTETPGRELFTTLKTAGNTGKSRVFIYQTPKISYQIMAVGLDKEFAGQKAQIDKVLRSFRLLKS